MPGTRFPNGVYSYGMPVLPDAGGELFTGNVFFVDSVNGNAGNDGKTTTSAFAGLQAAIDATTANNGDVIVVMENHTQTITTAAGIALNKAGITVLCLGSGRNKPQFYLTTTGAADINVSAVDIRWRGGWFSSTGIDAIQNVFDVDADAFSLRGGEFLLTSTAAQGTAVAEVAADVDECEFIDNYVYGASAGPAAAFRITGSAASFRHKILGNYIFGDFSVAAVVVQTSGARAIDCRHNVLINNNTTADLMWSFHANTTGMIAYNVGRAGDAATITGTGGIASTGCVLAQNFGVNLVGETGAEIGTTST